MTKVSDTPRTDRVARGRTEIASPTVVDVEFARTLERELAQARGNHQACTRMRESLERKLDEAEAALRAAPVSEEREGVAEQIDFLLEWLRDHDKLFPELTIAMSKAVRLLRAPQQQAEPSAALLDKAFNLGQRYWQQADSQSYADNRLAEQTLAAFHDLRNAAPPPAQQQAEPTALVAELNRHIEELERRGMGAISSLDSARNARADLLARYAAPPPDFEAVALLREIVQRYDDYRGKGVLPAPGEYQMVVGAIEKCRAYLARKEHG